MTVDDNTRNEKLTQNINREAAKIPALLSSKIDEYVYLTDEEVLLPSQSQIMKQAKFTYSPFRKL